MTRKNNQISTSQFLFSIGCFIQGSSLLTFAIHQNAKQEAWVAVVAGLVISLPIIALYLYLAKRYPGKDLFAINQTILGPIVGNLFSALYLLFFLTLVILNSNVFGNFVAGNLLPLTPMQAVLALFLFVCCWAACKGIKVATNYATFFVIISSIILLTSCLLLVGNMRIEYFLPLFSLPIKDYFNGAIVTAMLPICETMVFLMFLPNLRNPGQVGKAFWGGTAIGFITLLLLVANDTAVLGPLALMVASPTYAATRLISIGNVLTRMEAFYSVIWIILMFFKTSILVYAFFYGIGRLLKLKSFLFLVPAFWIILVILSSTVFSSSVEHANWVSTGFAPIYSSLFLVVLPVITLIVSVIRRLFGKKEDNLI